MLIRHADACRYDYFMLRLRLFTLIFSLMYRYAAAVDITLCYCRHLAAFRIFHALH